MVERNAEVAPDNASNFVSASISATVSRRATATLWATVSISPRLEGVELPGAVCLSDDPYRQVRSRLNSEIRDLGEKQLKNTQPSRCASIRSRSASRT